MGHSKGGSLDVWPLAERKKRREREEDEGSEERKEENERRALMYGHFMTERKEENEKGMRARRMGIDESLKRSKP